MKIIANEPRNRVFEFTPEEQTAQDVFDCLLDRGYGIPQAATRVALAFPLVGDEFLAHISDGTVPNRDVIVQAMAAAIPYGVIGCGCCATRYCTCGKEDCWGDEDTCEPIDRCTVAARAALASTCVSVLAVP